MQLLISGKLKRRLLLTPQMLKVMKLTFFLLTAALLHVSAKSVSQTITFSGKDVSLQTVFDAVTKQTGYTVFYNHDILLNAKKVTLDLKDASIETAMQESLKEQPLTYSIVEKTVVVKQKIVIANDALQGFFPPPPIDIHGRITDPDGEPLVGATIKVSGSIVVAVTDGDGRFTLRHVDENASIEISYVGFVTQTMPVKNRPNILMALKRSDSKLDEVQVIAYGKTTPRLSTGNVTTVKGEDIQKQPVSNPLLALEGRVPGLFITQNTGVPGGGVTVRIQGQNSFLKGNDPLYLIDGVPYSSQLLPNLAGSILRGSGGVVLNGVASGSGNPLSYINPGDIESIEVLKDADATAIYGSRAANGAILITTKKGKEGKTKVDINTQTGWGRVSHMLDLLNTAEYLQMRFEALKNDGISSPSATDYDLNGLWSTNGFTDWQKKLIGGTSHYSDAQASISGGNSITQFLLGTGYHKETTVFPGDFSDQKGSIHFNLNNISSNQRFKLQFMGSYMVDNNRLFGSDLTSTAIQLAPNAPTLYNTDGTLNWALNAAGNSTWMNPIANNILRTYENKTANLISNTILSYQVIKGLEIKSSFGYTDLQTEEYAPSPLISTKPENRATTARNASYANGMTNTWIIEPQAIYKLIYSKSKIELLVGSTFQVVENKREQYTGNGYNSDQALRDIKSASSVTVGSSINSIYKYNAVFARANYNLSNKYIINLTARRDGSTRFGPNDRFHNFGAIGGAWIFSQENLVQKNIHFLSFGKLRGSYGSTGNDQIGDYQFMDLYNSISVGLPYQGISALSVNGLPNPYLQWEETKKLQFGIDLGFLKDRFLLTANYVHNRSSNQLLSYALPGFTGFGGVIKNFPATIQNTAWEFSLNSTNIKTGEFKWTSDLNFTFPKNKLVAFPNLLSSSYATSLFIGQPISIVQAYHFLGVNPANGIFQFSDINGNPTSTPNFSTDRTILINTLPKFYGGLQNSLSFKGIQLDILFQFVKQIGPNYLFGSLNGAGFNTNQPTYVLQRWQKPGDITAVQRYNSNFSLFTQSSSANSINDDAAYSDASYLRLKNLSLSYHLPENWVRQLHLQNCRLYIQGQNLFTITKYDGLDPENLSTISLPPLRILTMGLQIGL